MVDAYADREQAGESLPANDRRPNHQAKRNAVTAVGFVCKRRFGEIVVTTYNKALRSRGAGRLGVYRMDQKCMPLPNYQKIVLNRINVCQ